MTPLFFYDINKSINEQKPVFVFKEFGACAKLPAGINSKQANNKRCWIKKF
jgi:hypothetical protein